MINRDHWPVTPWHLLTAGEARAVAAWEVRSEESDTEAVWKVSCLTQAFDAGRRLVLVSPIFEGDTGSWMYEQFKRKGCEHCRDWRRQAVPLTLVSTEGGYAIRDGRGHHLCGLKNYNQRDFPIALPADWASLDQMTALFIREAVHAGTVQPVFR